MTERIDNMIYPETVTCEAKTSIGLKECRFKKNCEELSTNMGSKACLEQLSKSHDINDLSRYLRISEGVKANKEVQNG